MGSQILELLDELTLDAAIENSAKKLEKETIALRRALHEIPELSWQEEKTIALIKRELESTLKDSPYTWRLKEMRGGLVVDLDINSKFNRLLFRADCDALPIHEQTNLPFASKHPGVMHACGHDAHSAILLSALKAIVLEDITPKNNLRFVWQRAEEVSYPQSGGNSLVEEGVCADIESVFGLHIVSNEKSGVFASRPGAMLSNSAQIHMEIRASGGHVMSPHFGSNAIDIATDLHMVLRGFAQRTLGPNEVYSFTPSISNSGVQSNIRPHSAQITYAFRNYLSEERYEDFIGKLKRKVSHIAECYDGGHLETFSTIRGYPQLINDPHSYHKSESLIANIGFETSLSPIGFAAEDFAYYLQEKPGVFWFLGADRGNSHDHHTPKFDIDEGALYKGVAYWLLLAANPL